MYGDELECDAPMPTPTPYGNRLTWKMPGQSNLIVHLKDKTKIRHKKRWSQVWQHMQLVDIYVLIVSLVFQTGIYLNDKILRHRYALLQNNHNIEQP